MKCENNGLVERLLKSEEELEHCNTELQSWTDALEDLSEIKDAFKMDEEFKLEGKTILDVGTDCIKPLYIALKFKPDKIVGINEELSYSYASDIEQKSKLFTNTKIRLYDCSFFDSETLNRILKKEKIKKFDFVLVSKTLHHLRSGECVANERDEEHECRENEKCCIYGFEAQKIFKKLFELGKRVIVYETYFPQEKDDDKVRGRGGYFTAKEWKDIFMHLYRKHTAKFIRPEPFRLGKETLNKIDSILRQVDCVCFYVESNALEKRKT